MGRKLYSFLPTCSIFSGALLCALNLLRLYFSFIFDFCHEILSKSLKKKYLCGCFKWCIFSKKSVCLRNELVLYRCWCFFLKITFSVKNSKNEKQLKRTMKNTIQNKHRWVYHTFNLSKRSFKNH